MTDILNNEPEQPEGNIFKAIFSQTKGNLEGKIKNMTVSVLHLKSKRKTRKSQSQGKRRKVKDIFTEETKRRNNGFFKIGSRYLSKA